MILRRLNIVSLVMLVLLIPVSHYYPEVKWWGLAFILLFQASILVYGSTNISSGYFLNALCGADTNEKLIALTFDDGPHPAFTAPILNTLKKYGVPAAFFCIGKNISGNEELLHRINTEGHIVGNHSYSHGFWFDMLGSKKMLADIQQMDKTVLTTINLKPILFRPPYGVTNPNVRNAVYKGKYIPIGWSVRSLDTTIKDKHKLLSRITDKLKGGDIILLHDSMEITTNILPELIERIQRRGFRIVPLDKMLNVNAYA